MASKYKNQITGTYVVNSFGYSLEIAGIVCIATSVQFSDLQAFALGVVGYVGGRVLNMTGNRLRKEIRTERSELENMVAGSTSCSQGRA